MLLPPPPAGSGERGPAGPRAPPVQHGDRSASRRRARDDGAVSVPAAGGSPAGGARLSAVPTTAPAGSFTWTHGEMGTTAPFVPRCAFIRLGTSSGRHTESVTALWRTEGGSGSSAAQHSSSEDCLRLWLLSLILCS